VEPRIVSEDAGSVIDRDLRHCTDQKGHMDDSFTVVARSLGGGLGYCCVYGFSLVAVILFTVVSSRQTNRD